MIIVLCVKTIPEIPVRDFEGHENVTEDKDMNLLFQNEDQRVEKCGNKFYLDKLKEVTGDVELIKYECDLWMLKINEETFLKHLRTMIDNT